MGSSAPEGTNHVVQHGNGKEGTRDPLMEQHISQGSSGLLEYKDNDTQVSKATARKGHEGAASHVRERSRHGKVTAGKGHGRERSRQRKVTSRIGHSRSPGS